VARHALHLAVLLDQHSAPSWPATCRSTSATPRWPRRCPGCCRRTTRASS
jgi:hypothetical protein